MRHNKINRFRMYSVSLALAIIFLAISYALSEKIELKNGQIMEGEIKEIKDDRVVLIIPNGETSVLFKNMAPASYYWIKLKITDKNDAQAHHQLAKYCLEHKLYKFAEIEYERTAQLDKSLKKEAEQKIEFIIEQDTEGVMKLAQDLMAEQKFKEALKRLQALLEKYPGSKYKDEITEAATFAARGVQNKLIEKQQLKELQEKKKTQEQLKKTEVLIRKKFNEALKLIEMVRQLRAEGLGNEAEYKISQADRVYKKAAKTLLKVKAILVAVINKTKDVNLITLAKQQIAEVNHWLTIVYNDLGQLWAIQLNLREALKWLNKTLVIEPENKIATELKVKIIDIDLRRKLLNQENR